MWRDHDNAFITIGFGGLPEAQPIYEGRQFLADSEKDGWMHVWAIDRSGHETLVTCGAVDTAGIEPRTLHGSTPRQRRRLQTGLRDQFRRRIKGPSADCARLRQRQRSLPGDGVAGEQTHRTRKPFDFMTYPDRTHSISEGPGTTVHLYHLLARYLTEHLPAGPL